jgi:hypothetical protein
MSNEQGPPPVHSEVVELESLRPHPRNYRGHPEAQLEHIAASLQQLGLYRNVVVANDYTLLAGHGVVLAAKKIGWKRIEVKRLELSPMSAQALKVLAADNELGRFAEDDDRSLTELLKEIRENDPFALLGTGYDDAQLSALLMVTRPASEIQGMSATAEWLGMPDYQDSEEQYQLVITFESEKARAEYVTAKGIAIIKKQKMTWSARYPNTKREDAFSVRFKGDETPSTPPPAEPPPEQPASRRRKKPAAEVAS